MVYEGGNKVVKSLDFKSGEVIENLLGVYEKEALEQQFFDNEEILKVIYGQYTLNVLYRQKGNVFKILILKDNNYLYPIVKQEEGDYESLFFTLQNYIGLLDSI
ncbi:hypothetical protein [Priestia megaterium]|uniref:Uncharacterized protein n=1 Tax=Priestia megaterium TaxID=1404 RepID=A0A6M6E2V1_PRIMG|nr:hypothetical protein [Priestia megaterium]QJX80046.1 hypothetical protein FDZ14_28490 [Priestia megaterium]